MPRSRRRTLLLAAVTVTVALPATAAHAHQSTALPAVQSTALPAVQSTGLPAVQSPTATSLNFSRTGGATALNFT